MAATSAQPARPRVAVIQLAKQPFFDEMYGNLIQQIEGRADVRFVTTAEAASEVFNGNAWPISLVTDEGLVDDEFRRQKAEAALYVRNGGTLVIGCHFPSFANMPQIKSLFSGLQLPWEPSSYHRTTFSLNPAMPSVSHTGLLAQYSQKAVHLKCVNQYDALYLATDSSRIESVVRTVLEGPNVRPDDLTETPAAFTRSGQGKVGYMGDVNGEDGTILVTLAMLGLNT